MDVLELIKNRRAIRRYEKRRIPDGLLSQIIEAGIWGPAVLTFQPWRFVIIQNEKVKMKIGRTMIAKSHHIESSLKRILKITAGVVIAAPVIVAVYNDRSLTKFAKRFGGRYSKIAKMAEIESIAAAIQNMILVAESKGLGAAWVDLPLLCEEELDKLLGERGQLIALLCLGYPAESGSRSKRKHYFKETKRIV